MTWYAASHSQQSHRVAVPAVTCSDPTKSSSCSCGDWPSARNVRPRHSPPSSVPWRSPRSAMSSDIELLLSSLLLPPSPPPSPPPPLDLFLHLLPPPQPRPRPAATRRGEEAADGNEHQAAPRDPVGRLASARCSACSSRVRNKPRLEAAESARPPRRSPRPALRGDASYRPSCASTPPPTSTHQHTKRGEEAATHTSTRSRQTGDVSRGC